MPWPKGRPHSAESRAKMSAARKGVPKAAEHRRKIGDATRGKPRPWLRGLTHTRVASYGSANGSWKGDAVTYKSLHAWVGRNFQKVGRCEECGREGKTEWSNRDHTYRRNREDWRELCSSCHKYADAALRRLRSAA